MHFKPVQLVVFTNFLIIWKKYSFMCCFVLWNIFFFHVVLFSSWNDAKISKKYQFLCSYLGKILSSRSAKLIGGRDWNLILYSSTALVSKFWKNSNRFSFQFSFKNRFQQNIFLKLNPYENFKGLFYLDCLFSMK